MTQHNVDVVVIGLGPGGGPLRAAPVTFTDPEVGAVGPTEAAAREAGSTVAAGSAPAEASTRGWIHGPGGTGVIKLVADTERDVLVDATAVARRGVLGLLALAVHARVPVRTLREMIFAYPIFHRGVLDALASLDRARTTLS